MISSMGAPESEYAQWLAKYRPKYPPAFKKNPVKSRELLRCAAARLTGDERKVASVGKRFGWAKENVVAISAGQAKLTVKQQRELLGIPGIDHQLWILHYSKQVARGASCFQDTMATDEQVMAGLA